MSSCSTSRAANKVVVDLTTTVPSDTAVAKAPPSKKKKTTTTTTTTPRKKKEPKEKRPGRFRSSCPQHLSDRIERAISQRLYLVERQEILQDGKDDPHCNFVVLGSTGNVYTVTLCGLPTCTCPDFARRQDLCKHLIFVMVKVIGLSTNDPLSYQKAYLPSEVRRLLEMARERRVGGAVLANRRVQQTFAKVKNGDDNDDNNEQADKNNGQVHRRSLEEDSDCPICFDSMTKLSETTYCRAQCGANFHTKCIRLWCQRSSSTSGSGQPTCPACRQPWQDDTAGTHASSSSSSSASKRVNQEGYVNLGALQGQSPERDTSTYYSPPSRRYGKRSRPWY